MIISVTIGAATGTVSGLLSLFFVEKARVEKSTPDFMKVWGAALVCRFVLVVAAIIAVWEVKALHPLAVLLPLIFVQTALQLFKPARLWVSKR